MLCEAYLDESEGFAAIPVLSVAGYLFRSDYARAFSARAERDLEEMGLAYFHQTDCAANSGPYAGFDKDRCVEAQDKLRANIHAHAIFGFGCSINLKSYSEIIGEGPRVPTAYAIALAGCMNAVAHWADRHRYTGDIKYIFESGYAHQNDAEAFLREEVPRDRSLYRHVAHSFVDKREALPLAAADMLAWYSTQEFTRFLNGRFVRRKDYEALIRPQDRRIIYHNAELKVLRATLERHGRL